MKLISLMCIALVILLTSFPATANINLGCYDNIGPCGRGIVGIRNNRWDPDRCCKLWSGNVSNETRYCACFALTYRFGQTYLPMVLDECKLPGVERFKTDFGHAVIIRRMIRMSSVASVVESAAICSVDGDEED
ncbi:hypothetical protein Bca101_062870 [Brassica carinata]